MNNFITTNYKSEIIHVGIGRSIEILNNMLENNLSENEYIKLKEMECIVDNIIKLNREMFKTKDLNKPFISIKGSDNNA